MGMVVQHNMNALTAYNKLNTNVAGLKKSSEKLSSGYRINRAGDDAAGLAISEKMRSQIRGLNQAKRNAQDGISMIQTYEGATQESHNILQRMKELASEAANGTYQNEVDRDAIQLEFNQLNDELDQIADTDFNGVVMLNGGTMADGTKQVGGKFDYVNSTRSAQQLGTAGGFVKDLGTRDYDDSYLTAAGITSERVTFTASVAADGKITWDAGSGKGTLASNTDNGGFTYAGVSVNVDTTKVVNGDTIVMDFAAKQPAKAVVSEVVGFNTKESNVVGNATGVTFAVDTNLKPANIVADPTIADALNALNGLSIEESIADSQTTATITSIGGVAVPAGTAKDIMSIKGGGKIQIADDGLTINYVNNGTTTALGKFTATKAATAQAGAKTVKSEMLVTQASYTAPKDAGIKLVEPDSKVSQANSNNAATAPLTYTDHLVLQTGARTKDSVDFTFAYDTDGMGDLKANMNISSRADGLGTKNLSLANQESANAAIDRIDNAINKVSMVRATFGATQNRLEHKIENLTTTAENITEAESNIRDTDMASEMLNYTKFNVLQQAAQSMLAQANQQPQSILQLLG
ncbi:MAG: flagellin [Oscillospiraceae bacterium]